MSNQSVNIREAFQARPGYYFMDPDYSQIEFRLSAALAGERSLLLGFKEGKDYYQTVYASMTGGQKTADDVTKQERQIGKVLALGQQYDQGPNGLARKLGCTYDTAKALMDQYWSGLAATARAKEQALQFALQNGYVLTWFGFKRYLPELRSDNRALRGKAMRSVWSTRIQGTAANWMKIAMLRAARALRQQNRDAHLLLTVHDELLFEVSFREPILEIVSIIRQAMEFKVPGLPVNHPDLYPDGFYCPAEFAYGLNWGHLFDDIEDTVSKGKAVQGWRSYCKENGIPVNFDDPRPEMLEIDFVAKPSTVPRVHIEPRKKVETESNDGKFIGCGKLDPVDAVIAWAKGEPPLDTPQMGMSFVPLPVETEEVIQVKKAPKEPMPTFPKAEPPKLEANPNTQQVVEHNGQSIVATVTAEFVPEQPPLGSYIKQEVAIPIPSQLSEPAELAQDKEAVQEVVVAGKSRPVEPPPPLLPANSDGICTRCGQHGPGPHHDCKPPTDGHTIKVPTEPALPPDNDYAYPCLVIRTQEELTKKKLEFLKALTKKYPGEYWLYIEYQSKIIRAGVEYRVDPKQEVLTYLKKAFGDKTTAEIFDKKESKARGKIQFV